jgi:hypothetical protein
LLSSKTKTFVFLLAAAAVIAFAVTSTSVKAATIQVGAGGDFQAALNAAQPGDIIELAAGATFVGPFTLPHKVGSGTDLDWITIRTSAPDSSLPPGQRVSPANASVMPKILSPGAGQAALYTQPRAHHYRFIGIEFAPTSSSAFINSLVVLGDFGANQDTLEEVPHHFVISRCYIHAFPTQSLKRGVELNSAYTEIMDSYIAGFKVVGQDTQAVMGWNGPGPFKITNNYLEGAGENLMFGGADPTIPNLVPSDIEIRRNYFFKPLSWRVGDPSYAGTHWAIKNLLELKNAQRVIIDGNLFENSWADAQDGYAILFTVRNQDGGAPWSVVQDVQFRNNIVRHAGSGVQLLGTDYIHTSQQTRRITIANNLFDDIDGSKWGGAGHFIVTTDGVADLIVTHNTIFHSGSVIQVGGTQNTGFVFNDNITRHNSFGVKGDGQSPGNTTLSAYFPNYTFRRNLIAGASASQYPADNYYPPASAFDAQFVNRAGGDYHIASTSQGYRGATDGKDVGADIDQLNSATAGAASGTWTTPLQTPLTGTPAAIPGRIEAENFDNGGEGSAYHDTTAGNTPGHYRLSDVDIEAAGDTDGAYNVGWAVAGEWLEYTVNVATAGNYTVEARVASQVNGGTFHIEFDGVDKTGAMTVPNTGGWQTYQTVTRTGVYLTAGLHEMRIAMDSNGATLSDGAAFVGNFNYVKFSTNNQTPFVLRINAGGGQYVGEGCHVWQADTYYQNGSTYYASGASIGNTDDDELYRGERYGGAPGSAPLTYAIPVPNSTYRVRLHFAEIWHGVNNTNGAGARVFDVSVENTLALDDFDIYVAAFGAQKAVVKEVQTTVSDGVLNLSFSASVDNAKISAIEVLEGTTPTFFGASYKEQNGQVVIEGESAAALVTRNGQTWGFHLDSPSGVCGRSMRAEPDSGVQIDTGYATTSPELQYSVQFTTPGTYYVWLRGFAENTSNNSVHIGIDGQPTATADRMSLSTLGTWTWFQSTTDGPVATLVVTSPGVHTINVWMREDGFWLDRLLLTTNSSFVPTGQAPPESSRVEH